MNGIRFSPNGEQIATVCSSSIRIFDARSGGELIHIKTAMPSARAITPLVWSDDGRRIFVAADDNKVKCFEVSTRSLLAESETLNDGDVESIALVTNGKLITAYTGHNILFLNTSTLTRVSPVIEESVRIESIALSPDSNYLATGQRDGKIAVRNLGSILPDLCGPSHVSIRPFVMLACRMSPVLSVM